MKATLPVDGSPGIVAVGTQGLRVAVRRGDGSRTPLLLMNGIGARMETFSPLIDVLDPALEIIRFDVPGVGGSSLPEVPYRFRTLSNTIGRLLDMMGYSSVDVLGISWGGALAQQFALSQRSKCRRVVLVATGTGALMVPGSPKVLSKMATPRRYRDRDYMLEIAPEIYGGSTRTDPDLLKHLVDAFESGGSRRAYALQLLAGVGWTSVPFLPLLRQPFLILAGDDDPIIPSVNGRMLNGLIRNSTLRVYRGGHIELVTNPEHLAPLIDQFLTSQRGTLTTAK